MKFSKLQKNYDQFQTQPYEIAEIMLKSLFLDIILRIWLSFASVYANGQAFVFSLLYNKIIWICMPKKSKNTRKRLIDLNNYNLSTESVEEKPALELRSLLVRKAETI